MQNQPNILLFLTDDHGAWATGCYGNTEVQSPVMDGLAASGARFENAFTPCPVCSPARACLLTGRTPSQVGMHDWIDENLPETLNRDWLQDEKTLPEMLHDAGYYCGLSGKWHLGMSHQTPRGFDWCFGLPGTQGQHIETFTYHRNGERITLTGNKVGFTTDYALDFLDQTPDDQPFFLNVGYIATHSPYGNQEPELVDLYRNATFPEIPPYVPHPWVLNEIPVAPNATRDDLLPHFRAYYAAVTDINRGMGRILDRLREQGKLENTLVVYTSDHGCTLGQHGFWGKGNSTRPLNMYETSLRVPLILSGPGVAATGTVIDRCVDHYDTFQTLCAVAGVPPGVAKSHARPGKSFRGFLQNPPLADTDWDNTRYGEFGDLRMIRTPEFKLVKRYPHGPDDLFDLRNDPGETQNLSGEAAHAAVEASLRERLEAWYRNHDDSVKSGLRVKHLTKHNGKEAWRDGRREARGLQVY